MYLNSVGTFVPVMENTKHLAIILFCAATKAPRLDVVCFHLLKLIMCLLTPSRYAHRANSTLLFILFSGHIRVKSTKMKITLLYILWLFR